MGGCAPGAEASCTTHRPKAADQSAPETQAQRGELVGHARPRPKAADPLINGLAACKGPYLKASVLNNSYLDPAHRALQGLLAL